MRSNYPADIRKGLILLEQLIKHEASDDDAKRNYLYYLALGNSRIKVSTEYQPFVLWTHKKIYRKGPILLVPMFIDNYSLSMFL